MNYKEMNELSVNNPEINSQDSNMTVGGKVRLALRKQFDYTVEDIKFLAEESGLTVDEYYQHLKIVRSELRQQQGQKRTQEKNKMINQVKRLQDGEIDEFIINLSNFGSDRALDMIFNYLSLTDGDLIITALDEKDNQVRTWTYNDRMRGIFRQVLKGEQFTEVKFEETSDAQVIDIIKNFDKLKVERVKPPKGTLIIDTDDEDEEGSPKIYQKNQAAFFKYYHNLEGIDLRRYNIFSNKDQSSYVDNCFLVALRSGGASEEVLQIVRTKMTNRYIKMGDIKLICKDANILVEVKVRTVKPVKAGEKVKVSAGKLKNNIYGDTSLAGITGKHFKLAIVDQHFILNEPLPFEISNYCLSHFSEMKDNLPTNYGKRENNKTARPKELCNNSFKLVEKLLDYKDDLLTRIPRSDLLDTPYYDQNKTINTLTFGDANYQSMEERLEDIMEKFQKSQEEEVCNIFLDFETNTKARLVKKSINEKGDLVKVNKGIRHIAYLGCMLGTFTEKGELIKNPVKTFYTSPDEIRTRAGERYIVDNSAGKKMIRHIANTYGHFKTINLIAHNCGYDMRVGLYSHIKNLNLIENGHQLIVGSGDIYKGRKRIPIKLKCSHRMIGGKLASFGEIFELPQEKEYMPYDLYTKKNINNRWVWYEKNKERPTEDYCMKYIKPKDKKKFIDNCNKWGLYSTSGKNKGKIDILKYSAKYCELDCIVLQQGYEKFREQIKTISKQVVYPKYLEKCPGLCVDIYNQYTISSVANEMMLIGGCYEDTYRISGVLREFIQKCVVGGRVMPCSNKKVKIVGGISYNKFTHKKEYIQDFDAVSMYNSSMCRIPGFIKGLPKILPDMSELTDRNLLMTRLNDLSKNSHYFLEINITRVGKKRDFPLMSVCDGLSREWTNDVMYDSLGNPWSMYVDRTMLEDWIKFHDIDFKIIRGYYFDEGYNPKVNKVMEFLFYERLKQKSAGNPIQNTYKLILNSGYGKTLEKAHEEKIVYKTNAELPNYLHRNYNFIKDMTQTNDNRWKVRQWNTIDTHFNQVHQGVSVLSMSKRIMNEVMCLAEDKGYGMFYTDTDSIHMFSECVDLLAEDWKLLYGGKDKRPKELIGEHLGQYHNDFDLVDPNWNDEMSKKLKKCKSVQSIKFIGLGKKCYLDILEGVSKITGDKVYGYHIRMKGVSTPAVEYGASEIQRQMGLDTIEEGAWEMYNKMFNDESVTFDLCKNADGSEKLCFKFFNDFTIGNMNTEEKDGEVIGFTRTAKFIGDDKLENNDFKNVK